MAASASSSTLRVRPWRRPSWGKCIKMSTSPSTEGGRMLAHSMAGQGFGCGGSCNAQEARMIFSSASDNCSGTTEGCLLEV
eukprot:scaffold243255_cov23-Tisochrysis_lutea.AAC.1